MFICFFVLNAPKDIVSTLTDTLPQLLIQHLGTHHCSLTSEGRNAYK